jgi:DNA primase
LPRFSDNTIDQIKRRLSISDVMENYAHIENRGNSKWVKCPFHGGGTERTASCKIDDERGTYYCFGCHESGDIFSLVMKKEGLDFSAAVETLAKKAGVTLEEGTYSSSEGRKRHDEKESMYELYSGLQKSFHYLLLNSKEAESAREYLGKRGVSEEMTETFQLGFAPSSPGWLYSFLRKKNYSDDFLARSGFFSQKNPKWPLFVNRMMFPIRDRQGRTIAFSGRDLSGSDRAPKYINSPETVIYQKKENFFGLFEAKKTIADSKSGFDPILCEGNFDVVAMHQAGFTSAVASLGTSFTIEQCRNMKKWFPNISSFHMLFDSDAAGQNSTVRAIMIINSTGLEQKVHKLTSAKDASELLEKSGTEGVKREFESYSTGFDYLVQNNLTRYDVKNARGKSDLVRSLGEYLNSCQSEVERDSYILSLASLVGLDEEVIKEDLKKVSAEGSYRKDDNGASSVKRELRDIRTGVGYDLFVMLYLCNHRGLFSQYRTRLKFGDLEDSDAQKIYMALENAMRDDVQEDSLFLTYISDDDVRNYVSSSFALDEYRRDRTGAVEEAIVRISLRSLERKRNILNQQISLIGNTDADTSISLMTRKAEYDKKIAELRKEILSFDSRSDTQ